MRLVFFICSRFIAIIHFFALFAYTYDIQNTYLLPNMCVLNNLFVYIYIHGRTKYVFPTVRDARVFFGVFRETRRIFNCRRPYSLYAYKTRTSKIISGTRLCFMKLSPELTSSGDKLFCELRLFSMHYSCEWHLFSCLYFSSIADQCNPKLSGERFARRGVDEHLIDYLPAASKSKMFFRLGKQRKI